MASYKVYDWDANEPVVTTNRAGAVLAGKSLRYQATPGNRRYATVSKASTVGLVVVRCSRVGVVQDTTLFFPEREIAVALNVARAWVS